LTDTDDAAIAELFALAAAAAIAPKGVHLRLHTAHAQAATAAARARTGRGALLQRLAREKRARSRAAGLVIAHDAHAPLLHTARAVCAQPPGGLLVLRRLAALDPLARPKAGSN